MGQAATKHHHAHDGSDAHTASSRTSHAASQSHNYPSTVDGGALGPQGVYTGPQDYSHDVVKTAIVKRKLMPFYKGMDNEHAYTGHAHVSECPICFLYYPSTLNRTRCCGQPICTECFVQIKRADPNHTNPPSSQPAECPFCTADHFGVVFTRPSLSPSTSTTALRSQAATTESEAPSAPKRKSFSHCDPEVLTTDMVRPDWHSKLAAAQAATLRRANRRIIMRQVGERLIPIGVSSSRIGAELPEGSGPGGAIILREGERWQPFSRSDDAITSSVRRGSRRDQTNYMHMAGQEVEDMMMMEAMRLSLIEHEEQQRRQASASQVDRASATVERSGDESQNSSASPQPGAVAPSGSNAGVADLCRKGSGVRRSSSTSRGQPMSAPSHRAQRLSKEMREFSAALSENEMGSSSPSQSAATAGSSSPCSAVQSDIVPSTFAAPVLPAPPLSFGLRDDVMTELAELIDEPNEDLRQRIEAAREAANKGDTATTEATMTSDATAPSNSANSSTLANRHLLTAPTPLSSSVGPAAFSSSPTGTSRPLNPNNPFRTRMASSGTSSGAAK